MEELPKWDFATIMADRPVPNELALMSNLKDVTYPPSTSVSPFYFSDVLYRIVTTNVWDYWHGGYRTQQVMVIYC